MSCVSVGVVKTMWVRITPSHQLGSMLPCAVGGQHAAPIGLGDHCLHCGQEVPTGVCIRGEQLFQQASRAAVRAQRGAITGLALRQRLHGDGGQARHPCLAIHALVIVLLGLGTDGGGVEGGIGRATPHRGGGGGLGGRLDGETTAGLRVLVVEEVEVMQKVLHEFL